MRLIVLIVALLLVGLLVHRQLNVGTSNQVETKLDEMDIKTGVDTPSVPTRPQDVKKFGQDMNEFINKAASERAEKLNQEQY
ncbi:MAG: hypothetical protein HWE39_01410 [Oceanospirillaceae bacterium]|nr:hypothetical protein [Oceanospirillaceae bacterium]